MNYKLIKLDKQKTGLKASLGEEIAINKNRIKQSLYKKRIAIFFFLIIIVNLSKIKSKKTRTYVVSYSSSIYLTINGIGFHQVFSSDKCSNISFIIPDKIYINNRLNKTITSSYYLDKTANNVTLYWEREIISTACLFKGSYNITEIDLSNFNTSELVYIHGMFWKCKSLISINFNNFNTSKVIDMHFLFSNCSEIEYINLNTKYFDTSLVTSFQNMFCGCSSLKSLDVSNFDTSKVEVMNFMFSYCDSLTSLDLSNFNTYSLKKMTSMFENSKSLLMLDLSNFNTSRVYFMAKLFYNCENLEYINLKNSYSDNTKTINLKEAFTGTAKNLVLCTDNDILINASKLECTIINCDENWRENQKKLFNDSCYNNCSSIGTFDYYSKCYQYCPDGTYENYNNYICEECDSKCAKCNDSNICNECKNGYYNIYINESYIICKESFEGYYKEYSEPYYKPCYKTCKSCHISGNNETQNCLKCKPEYLFETKIDDSGLLNCYTTNYKKIKNKEAGAILQKFKDLLINDFDSSLIDNAIQLEEEEKTVSIFLKEINNQTSNNDNNKNETIINLGECEKRIKDENNIPYNDSLYLLKVEVKEKGMKIPKVEYELYYPLNGSNLYKLNLTLCKNMKIDILIPVSLTDDIDKHNSSSDYYNNICSRTTSKFVTDICLKDRKDEFIDNNMTLCEENCDLEEYDKNKEIAKCSCFMKISLPFIEDIIIDKNQLYKSFSDISYFANIKMMKCIKLVLSLDKLRGNYGFYIFTFVMIIYAVVFFLFVFKYFIQIKINILKIVVAKKNLEKNKTHFVENKTNKKKDLKKKSQIINSKHLISDLDESNIGNALKSINILKSNPKKNKKKIKKIT